MKNYRTVDNKSNERIDQYKSILYVSKFRLYFLCSIFFVCFSVLAIRATDLILFNEKTDLASLQAKVYSYEGNSRNNIYDRNGTLLATNISSSSLFANPKKIKNKIKVSESLSKILEGKEVNDINKKLSSKSKFVWIKRQISPREHAEINKLGIPGLGFQTEPKRIYPQKSLTSHVIGYVGDDNYGQAGIEKQFNKKLSVDSSSVNLTLDIRVQHALRDEMYKSMQKFNAIGAAGIIIDVKSGEIISMVSLPDFDPHKSRSPNSNQYFNRATLGIYEMGSTFKFFTLAAALENQVVTLRDRYDARKPFKVSRFTITDVHPEKRWLSVSEVFQHSSNIGTAKIAIDLGGEKQKIFFEKLGLLSRPNLQIPEIGNPIIPNPWRKSSTVTASYGHGIAVSLLQVAVGYASLVNGGMKISPTLILDNKLKIQERIISNSNSKKLRFLLRSVVQIGTGSKADAPGYLVGGKTGTAIKAVSGGYDHKSFISSFASIFPSDNPQFAIVVMLDEPKGTKDTFYKAYAGWTVAPIINNVVNRIAPLLEINPKIDIEAINKYEAIQVSTEDNL